MSGESLSRICCYKNCLTVGTLDERVEVKTVMPKTNILKKVSSQLHVSWRKNGEAEFHTQCWDNVYTLSRSRATKKGPNMTKEEKSMVKVAAESPEQFDSIESIKANAKRAANWVKISKHMVAFTGAGISTSAGIGDYRGKAGKWTEEDQSLAISRSTVFEDCSTSEPPEKKHKTGTESASSSDVEENEEDGVPYEKLRPTYTHEALNKLRENGYLKYIISQNGDGLHLLSGIPANQISELHGNVFIEVCEKCEKQYYRKFYVMDDAGSQYFEELEDYGETSVKKPKHAKKCDLCGLSHRTGRKCEEKCRGYLRDTIINFRDLLDDENLDNAWDEAKKCDVMLCLGTTLQVTPACDLVKKTKKQNKLIICNRQETPVDEQFQKKDSDGASARGCRVFGDCDFFMKEIMRHIYSAEDLKAWEAARPDRMKEYDKLRD